MFCLQIHAFTGNTMNSKLFIKKLGFASCFTEISRSFCCQPVCVFVNKPLTGSITLNYAFNEKSSYGNCSIAIGVSKTILKFIHQISYDFYLILYFNRQKK